MLLLKLTEDCTAISDFLRHISKRRSWQSRWQAWLETDSKPNCSHSFLL